MKARYTFVNGMPVRDSSYQSTSAQPTTSGLTIITTLEEQEEIARLTNLPVPEQFQQTVARLQSRPYLAGFESENIDGGELVEDLVSVFNKNQIPLGLISKLTPLQGATLHFKIDDSSSMKDNANLYHEDVCDYTKQHRRTNKRHLCRWEEAEDRLHTLIELLAYVPTGPIILSFFDRPNYGLKGERIVLDRRGKLPKDFLKEAHAAIYQFFSREPKGDTPIYDNMKNMLDEANANRGRTDARTMHYLLSDGEPNDGATEIKRIKDLLLSAARNPVANPFTFLGCSNLRADYAWMHELEEIAQFVATLPDFQDELAEVRRDQGAAFPYNRGFWLLCNICAAINPDDLDALDQHAPLGRLTFENLMGRGITEAEFTRYFDSHPNAGRVFAPDFQAFLTMPRANDIPAVKIFTNALQQGLKKDIDENDDDTEVLEVTNAENAVSAFYARTRYAGRLYTDRRAEQYFADKDRSCVCRII